MIHSRKRRPTLASEVAMLRQRVAELESESRMREESLLTEVNYRAIFDAANDAIFVHDIETGAILDVNRKMCEMYGYTPEETRRLNVEDLSAGEKPFTQEDAIHLITTAARGEPQLFEWMAKDKSGRLFWVEVNLKRAFIGGKDRLLAIVRDISERKRAEEALKRRIEFIGLITGISTFFINLPMDQIDEGATYALRRIGEFASVDRSYIFQLRDGDKKMDNTHEWCAEGIEPHIHRLKGLSVDDFSWLMPIVKKGNVCYVPRVADLSPGATVEKAEWQLEGIQSLICVPMISRGRVIGFVGFDSVRQEKTWDEETIALLKIVGEILSNALERKRADEALRESESRYRLLSEHLEEMVQRKVAELQQAESLAAIGQMVSVVAHEVRNPLQNIRMGVDVLRAEVSGDASKAETLAGIEHGVSMLNSIITELLEYSRPVELRYSSRPVGAIVEDALKALSHKLHTISVTLELEQNKREITVDGVKFAAVLVNLISNAIEAMPSGGDLRIFSHFCKMNGNDVLRLSIKDTGCGIAEEDIRRIQEPFVTTKIRGTGLGLPICRKIVEAHKGRMQINSKLHEGTTVEITLPA
ncbi:MAG: PAS domain S-box protein [Candidatus Lindowbacteria bacterium]|nr:PAS domain S-box protein [Candidatus Lindowbacteria bacterium]